MTVGRMGGEHYFIWIRDNFGLVEASLVWKSPDSSWSPRAHAWKIIGYDLQKWKVIGNNVRRTTCHPIPPLCKMISEICYSFPLVRYKYCLFADLNFAVPQRSWGLYVDGWREVVDEWSALFRFSTIEVAAERIDSSQDLNTHGIRLLDLNRRKIVPLG